MIGTSRYYRSSSWYRRNSRVVSRHRGLGANADDEEFGEGNELCRQVIVDDGEKTLAGSVWILVTGRRPKLKRRKRAGGTD